jgi:hypothetical protein
LLKIAIDSEDVHDSASAVLEKIVALQVKLKKKWKNLWEQLLFLTCTLYFIKKHSGRRV